MLSRSSWHLALHAFSALCTHNSALRVSRLPGFDMCRKQTVAQKAFILRQNQQSFVHCRRDRHSSASRLETDSVTEQEAADLDEGVEAGTHALEEEVMPRGELAVLLQQVPACCMA